jgi:hypothetical protein
MQAVGYGAIGGLVLILGYAWMTTKQNDPNTVAVQQATVTGKVPYYSKADLPRSVNQAEGATFSFDGWFVVNDFTYGYGKKRLVFTHGDCPGVYLDSTSNSILVLVNTFGSVESVMISNIPAQKWIHIGVVVTQYTVDVYINGMLRQHHTLTQLPKQEESATQIGSDSTGFDGQVGGLTYYARALSASEISTHAAAAPPTSLVQAPASGQYLDISWYLGR